MVSKGVDKGAKSDEQKKKQNTKAFVRSRAAWRRQGSSAHSGLAGFGCGNDPSAGSPTERK